MVCKAKYLVDFEDPRAPSQEIWNQLDEQERLRICSELPSEFPAGEAYPPEGDYHYEAVKSVRDSLRRYFRRLQRRVYVGSNLPIYYPGEPMFSVDALVVLDTNDAARNSWVVSKEGKGIDFAIEIHWLGNRAKDFDRNVRWFASLGIKEYFVFDARHLKLVGFGQSDHQKTYVPILPQTGRFYSQVLGLELGVEFDRLKFYAGGALLPDAEDLIQRLDSALVHAQNRFEEESRRVDEEARRAQQAEQQLAEALAELERLRSKKH